MSDLSRLLEDVYGDSDAHADVVPSATTQVVDGLPEWPLDPSPEGGSSEWVPGPQAHAAGAPADRVDGTTGLLLPSGPDEAVDRSTTVETHVWRREDDDILPIRGTKGAARRGSAAARSAKPVTTPTAEVLPDDGPVPAHAHAPAHRMRLRRRQP